MKIFLLIILLWIKRKGTQKKVIEIKLNEYVPIKDKICMTSILSYQVYAIKFHGKPVSIFPLKNSNIEKIKAKNNIKDIFLSIKFPTIRIDKPKNNDKKSGINKRAKGIRPLNISSWVREMEIQ